MNWWGKLIGGTFGYMLGGPIGALLGAALGHKFDKGLSRFNVDFETFGGADVERIQTVFFTTTFSVMGHIAKADGHVSTDEIDVAKQLMAQMQLNQQQRQAAIKLFNEGKQADFPLEDVITQFKQECRRRQNLMRMFIEIQLHAAYADGTVHAKERQLLQQICLLLGFSNHEFNHIERMVQAAHSGFQQNAQGEYQSQEQLLSDAYSILDIKTSASDAEVKKAYRRLMSQHHPDKLVSKGLPEEMIKIATEKSQEIRAAYDLIQKTRGMR